MKLTGPLTAAAGIMLAVVTIMQAQYLTGSGARNQRNELRAEMRGLASALLWRMKRDLVLHDHNRPSMKRALIDIVKSSQRIDDMVLSNPQGTILAASESDRKIAPELLQVVQTSRPEDLPIVSLEKNQGEFTAATRIQLESRELILVSFSSLRNSPERSRSFALTVSALVAGLSAALLLVARGISEILRPSVRKARPC